MATSSGARYWRARRRKLFSGTSNSLPLISIFRSFVYGRKRAPGELIARIVAGTSCAEKRKGGSFGRGDPGTAIQHCLKSLLAHWTPSASSNTQRHCCVASTCGGPLSSSAGLYGKTQRQRKSFAIC